MPSRSPSSARSPNTGTRLRSASQYANGIGVASSLALVLRAGRHNPSVFLVALFVLWVLSPYFGLFLADRFSRRTPPGIASAIHAATLVLALVPPAIYTAVSFLAPGHMTTFAFLVVPGASWLAIATLLIAARLQRK